MALPRLLPLMPRHLDLIERNVVEIPRLHFSAEEPRDLTTEEVDAGDEEDPCDTDRHGKSDR